MIVVSQRKSKTSADDSGKSEEVKTSADGCGKSEEVKNIC